MSIFIRMLSHIDSPEHKLIFAKGYKEGYEGVEKLGEKVDEEVDTEINRLQCIVNN